MVRAGRVSGRARGFSLIELMVGLLLGVILMAGAATIYLSSKRSYVEVEQVAALSENARFVQLLVTDSLRHVGNFGETTANNVDTRGDLNPVVNDCTTLQARAYDVDNFLFAATATGVRGGAGVGDALGCIDDAAPGTDVLVIKRVLPQPYTDAPRDGADPNDPGNSDGVISFPEPLSDEKTYVMSNDIGGIVFDGADLQPSITTGGDIPGGSAFEYQFEVYYARKVPGATADRDRYWLARKTLEWNGAAIEVVTEDVVEGVEDLHLMFGFDGTNNGEVDTYQDLAGLAGSWGSIESLELFMLIRSATDDVQYTDEKVYNMGGGLTVQPGGNYRRMVTHASVSLRNLKLIIRGGT